MTGLKDPDVSVTEDIIFKDVTFAYPTRPDTVVLDRINLRFETGKTTAIVGPSGSGKSTIVGLLQRWYHPTEEKPAKTERDVETPSGQESDKEKADIEKAGSEKEERKIDAGIFIGGINLSNIDAKWWRTNVGMVQQEPFLFNDTIYKNVALGLTGTKHHDLPEEEKLVMVQNACQEAFAADFIEKLPEVCRVQNHRWKLGLKTDIVALGIRHDGWRERYQDQWWPTSKTGYCPRHNQTAANSHS
jgi:ATP-binding cassette, subfamily B (MDR/TAP), member 1